jgi:hypothetical protein
MNASFLLHLQDNWPLAAVVFGLLLFVPIVLVTGIFPTNQGSVVRSRDPATYWRWVIRFGVLLLVSMTVLLGSYYLLPK